MTYIMVDIEADGPIPGDYSMVSFGAIVVGPGMPRGRSTASAADRSRMRRRRRGP